MPETFIEISPYYYEHDTLPSCDVVSCGYSFMDDPPLEAASRRMFRQVGGVDDGLLLCEKCMEPANLAAAKPLIREPR